MKDAHKNRILFRVTFIGFRCGDGKSVADILTGIKTYRCGHKKTVVSLGKNGRCLDENGFDPDLENTRPTVSRERTGQMRLQQRIA